MDVEAHSLITQLTIASKAGPKLELAQELGIADTYITISDDSAHDDMDAIRAANPYGFDIVVEATGSPVVLEQAIQHAPLERAVRPAALKREADRALATSRRRLDGVGGAVGSGGLAFKQRHRPSPSVRYLAVQPPSMEKLAPLAEAPRSLTR